MTDIDPNETTVAELKANLDGVTDPAELEAIKQAEADGKDRTTAHAAIDAKAAELSSDNASDETPAIQSNGEATENVTAPPHIDGAADEDQPATVLVQAPKPEELTDAQINEATGDGLKDDASQQQADAANALVEARENAQSDDEPDHTKHPLYGYGPGADIG